MKKTSIRLTLIAIVLVFFMTAIPYVRPAELEKELRNKVEYDLNNLPFKNEKVKLIDNPIDAFNVRMAMIQNAQKTIDVSAYIFHEGPTTDLIFSDLIRAADRGVKVRIISDYKMGGMRKAFASSLNAHENIEIYNYNPFRLFKPSTWQSVHHEKYLNVDQEMVLIGGRNYGDKYFSLDEEKIKTVNDYDVLILSETNNNLSTQVYQYTSRFIKYGSVEAFKSKVSVKDSKYLDHLRSLKSESYDLSLYTDNMHDSEGLSFMTNAMRSTDVEAKIAYALKYLQKNSKEEIYLQSPYLTANKETLYLLNESKAKGLKISLLTNSISSSSNYPAYSNYYINKDKFINTGIDIYEYQSTGYHSQHGKAYIFDNMLAIGSANLDDRSFFINTESMLFIESEGLRNEMLDSIDKKIKQSVHIAGDGPDGGLNEEYKVGLLKRIIMYISSIFSRMFSFLV